MDEPTIEPHDESPDVLTGPVMDEHHPAPADTAHLRVEHPLHERAGDRGVDRVAAAAQHVERDLGGLRLRADDDRHLSI